MKLKISDELMSKWKELHAHGDFKRVHDDYGISFYKITLAFTDQIADEKTFDALKKFYTLKSENLKSQDRIAENMKVA